MDYSKTKNTNMKFNIKHALGITVLLCSQAMVAQFYVGVQTGIGHIKNDIKAATPGYQIQHSGAVKAGYIYSLTNHFGIGTGLEFSQYKQDVSLNNSSEALTNFEVDPAGSAFIYNITTSNYREEQTLHAIQIPLFLQYKTNIAKGVDFNFRAGAKYFLPVDYKIKSSAAFVNGTAYYPDVNLYIDDLPEYGFGGQGNYSASGEYNTKGTIMASYELGFTFDVNKNNALYTAIFVENGYGTILNQNEDKSYIGYNPTSVNERKANGLYSTDKDAKIRPVAFGLTFGWNFK